MRIAHLSLALILGFASTIVARAENIHADLPLNTATSSLDLSVTLNGTQVISADVPFTGGTFDADIAQTGTLPPPLNLTDITGDVEAGDFTIHTPLGGLLVDGLSLAIGPAAGPFLTNGKNPAQVNLAGLPLSVDKGSLTVLGISIVNFAETHVNFKLPTTMATLNDSILSLHVPVDASGSKTFNFFGHKETLAYSLTGSVNFAGPIPAVAIPEPSTIVLAAVGGLALLALSRKRAARAVHGVIAK
jgi:hypothetical protein